MMAAVSTVLPNVNELQMMQARLLVSTQIGMDCSSRGLTVVGQRIVLGKLGYGSCRVMRVPGLWGNTGNEKEAGGGGR